MRIGINPTEGKIILDIFESANYVTDMADMIKYYRVGGCVRDEQLGQRSKDIDYAVEAPSWEAMRQDVLDGGGEIFLEKPEFLTIRAKLNKEAADFVLARKDGSYSDARHPDTVQIGTIDDDLARRDFTMNAMAIPYSFALSERGDLYDPHGGMKSIRDKIIRCVGLAEQRFGEDALRMLRAIRFSVTKDMCLDDDIQAALHNTNLIGLLEKISEDRIRDELNKAYAFDTMKTIKTLNEFPLFRDAIFGFTNLTLEATSKKRT